MGHNTHKTKRVKVRTYVSCTLAGEEKGKIRRERAHSQGGWNDLCLFFGVEELRWPPILFRGWGNGCGNLVAACCRIFYKLRVRRAALCFLWAACTGRSNVDIYILRGWQCSRAERSEGICLPPDCQPMRDPGDYNLPPTTPWGDGGTEGCFGLHQLAPPRYPPCKRQTPICHLTPPLNNGTPPPHKQIRETCAALERVSDRLSALRRRAEVLEAELEADGCVAGDGVSELRL